MFKRLIASFVCLTFIFSNIQSAGAQDFSINQLPVPGTMVGESLPFAPLTLKGLVINPQKPLEFQFIVDAGNTVIAKSEATKRSFKEEANTLVKYFLAGLTIPEGDLWVNLSPYEKNRMVPEVLGQTDLGRDLLAQDYILKQLTASLIYPEKDLGKEFWSRVYAKAQQQFGTTNIHVNTFNKVWVLPNQAQVFENSTAAYVTKSTLKVMLDEDYTALQKHMSKGPISSTSQNSLQVRRGGEADAAIPKRTTDDTHALASQIVRAIILPEIEKEVNTGKNFAPLRQIYQALILAKWYKETIQNSLLDAIYTNKKKVIGVNLDDPSVKEQIYQRYLQAYKKGAFNYIKEDPTPDGQKIPRKYFSGGIKKIEPDHIDTDGAMSAVTNDRAMLEFKVELQKSREAPDLLSQEVLYQSLGLSFLRRPLNMKIGADVAMTYDAVQWIKSHPMFTAGMSESEVEADAAMSTEFLIGVASGIGLSGTGILIYFIKGYDTLMKEIGTSVVGFGMLIAAYDVFAGLRMGITHEAIIAVILSYPSFTEGMLLGLTGASAITVTSTKLTYRTLPASGLVKLLKLYEKRKNYREFNIISAELHRRGNPNGDFIYEFHPYRSSWTNLGGYTHEPTGKFTETLAHWEKIRRDKVTSQPQARKQTPDTAMLTSDHQVKYDKAALAENGGIDLNQIAIKRTSHVIKVQFDPAQLQALEQGGFQGFTPVIINITPISSPFQLLGINTAKKPETLAKV